MLIEGKLGNLEWKGEQTLENMGIHFATCASQWQVAMWKQGLAMQSDCCKSIFDLSYFC